MVAYRLLCFAIPGVLAALLPTTGTAQGIGPAANPELEALAQRLDKAHLTDPAAKAIRGFDAHLRMGGFAKDAKQRGEIEFAVSFLEWIKPSTGRPWPLIRYRQVDSADTIEYGRDQLDYWALLDGRIRNLRSRELERDLESCRSNLRLARQLIRFLEPGTELRSMTDVGPIQQEPLRQGRARAVECTTVTGKLEDFPMLQTGGEQSAVRAKAFIDPEGRLLGLEVTPLNDQGVAYQGQGEFIMLQDYRTLGGRLVPMKITHFAVPSEGVRKQQRQVQIVTLEVDPGQVELSAPDFDRPAR